MQLSTANPHSKKNYTGSELKKFNWPFTFLQSTLARKHLAEWSSCSWDVADLRTLKFDLAHDLEPEFSQISDLCTQKANNINFHLPSNREKVIIKFL